LRAAPGTTAAQVSAAAPVVRGRLVRQGAARADVQADGRTLRISVCDNGPGFPPELLDAGIRPFFSMRERGTGLGLAMVRRFARDVGGTLELANRIPHGAQVTLILPADAQSA